MSKGSSTVRLSKAAREFNVGATTIVEYLSKQGHQIDPNPNTKLNAEMYALLVKEFQLEKQVKEVSQKLGIEYSSRKTITAEEVLKQEAIEEDEDDFEFDTEELLIKNIQSSYVEKPAPAAEPKKIEKVEPPVEEPETLTESPSPADQPKADTDSEKESQTKITVEASVATEIPALPIDIKEIEEPIEKEIEKENKTEKTVEASTEQVDAPKEEVRKEGELKIIGKIDLESMNLRTKPDRKTKAEKKKEEEQKRKEKEAEKEKKTAERRKKKESKPDKAIDKPTKSKKDTPAKAAETSKPPKQEPAPKAEAQEAEKARPDNFLPTTVVKLQGPKILDKIELPDERRGRPKPVASSSEEKISSSQKKKKRKRIKKETTDASTQPASTQQGQHARAGQKETRRGRPAARREEKVELSEEDIQRQIKETLARLSPTGKSRASKHRRMKREAVSSMQAEELAKIEQEKSGIKVTEFVTANELATMMDIPVTKVIATCMSLGLVVSINQRLDAETLSLVAEEFGFEVEFISHELQDILAAEIDEPDNPEDLVDRAPIVTVMGHVDHGKTALLDYIRKANVASGEAGGITQHIGAYEVSTENGKKITFLDTPGHEAFTAIRARGAKITDVAIIVIAADDSVMPQTKEAINHAKAAGVPIVFAFNKIDKPTANAEKIREQLANMNILVEDWGGKYQSQEISAKMGTGIKELLEKVLLEAEILELKGNPKRSARGTIVESSLDKGRGYVAKILVEDGSLKIGDLVLAGSVYGRVKAMFNERNKHIEKAGPSTPTLMLGLNGAPQAGDSFVVLQDEREMKNIAAKRQQLQREQGIRTQKHITLDEIGRRIAIGDFRELNLIVKGDVDGSIEALSDSLLKLSTDEVQVNVIHKSVGAINESDVMLASASDAIIIGFQVRPTLQARKLSETEEIDIRLYSVIYQAIEELESASEGMHAPEIEEVITCNLEVRETFKISKIGTIAGCMVLDGKITRNTKIRLIRDGIVIFTGNLGSLKRFKDDVREVNAGYECGLNIDGFNDIKIGDIIEGFTEKEVSRKA